MKKLEQISANVMNECVLMNLYECTVNDEKKNNKEWLRATKPLTFNFICSGQELRRCVFLFGATYRSKPSN
jgi:hypothetical protein